MSGTICVYCGSSPGKSECFSLAVEQFGHELVRRQLSLVYGGGSVGLMGKLARVVSSGGGQVLGIIPESLHPTEISGETPGRVMVTKTMHERKTHMADLADAFVALPGGIGTLEELFEIATWRQLGHHSKAIGLLNVNGFFDTLLKFIDELVSAGFISYETRALFIVESEPRVLLDKLSQCGLRC